MGVKFELRGLEETITRLDMSVRKVNDGSNEALKHGAETLKSTIQSNTPRLTGEAQTKVITTGVRTATSSVGKSILVGYSPDVSWRMWFLEEGTYSKGNPKGIRPMKIVEGSMNQSSETVSAVIAHYMSEVIGGV